MAQLTYPGVYIEEVPSGVRAITAVSTSIAAFVDRFTKGPTDEPTLVFGMADVERVFGGIDPISPASYGLSQFFLNGGSQAWVVRVETAGVAAARTAIGDESGNTVLTLIARSEGAWANEVIRARIDPPVGTGGNWVITISQYASRDPEARPIIQERFEALRLHTVASPVPQPGLIEIIQKQSALVTALDAVGTPDMPAANGVNWPRPPAVPAFTATTALFNVTVQHPTLTSTAVPGAISLSPPITTVEDLRIRFERALRTAGINGNEPALAGASVVAYNNSLGARWRILLGSGGYHPGLRLLFSGPAAEALGLAGAGTGLDLTSSRNNPQEYTLGASWLTAPQGAHRSRTLGDNGAAATAADLIGNRGDKSGMYALLDVDLFNLLCMPAIARLTSGDSSIEGAYGEAEGFCSERRAFLLVDPPPDVVDFTMMHGLPARLGLRSPNAAWFVPHVVIADKANDFQPITVAPSGTIAGIMARTDAAAGPWLAPAGVDAVMRGVVDLEYKLTDQENGRLNQQGTNCLRSFPVQGRIVWGARTRRGADDLADEWKYIPIRRLALMIEESLFRGTKWAVFQPNDEPLWARLRQNVGAFMHRLFRQGAFQGATPREAYFVRCDRQTNPPENRELGIVTVEVGFAPLKPAEFVLIRIQQIAELTA